MADKQPTIVQRMPFKLYPLNKSSKGRYSYYESSPILTFQWAQNEMRVIDSSSLYVCGRMRVKNRNKLNQPANRFDLDGTAGANTAAYEQVCYIDDRVGVNSVMDNVTVGDLQGSVYEQAKAYARHMSSLIGTMNSYKNMCSNTNMSTTACANLDVMSREVCSDVKFALPFMNGFFNSNPMVDLLRGLEIKVNLSSDNNVLFGKDADQGYVYELFDVFVMGDYLVLERPMKQSNMSYSSYHNFHTVLNSGNDHSNTGLNLSMVNKLYHNFIPATWTNNYKFSAYCTPPLLQYTGADYEEAKIKRYNISRGAVRFPNNFSVDETLQNTNGVFDTIRSREYLSAIVPYDKIEGCLISPDTEARTDMVEARSAWKKTPQGPDQGLMKAWVKDNGSGEWDRTGEVEKASQIYGLGISIDPLFVRANVDYTSASYNFVIESEIDDTANNAYVYCLASTKLQGMGKRGMVVAMN